MACSTSDKPVYAPSGLTSAMKESRGQGEKGARLDKCQELMIFTSLVEDIYAEFLPGCTIFHSLDSYRQILMGLASGVFDAFVKTLSKKAIFRRLCI